MEDPPGDHRNGTPEDMSQRALEQLALCLSPRDHRPIENDLIVSVHPFG